MTIRYDLALIGFGGVNRALAELIASQGDELPRNLGFDLRVVAITDLRAGSLVQPDGIDLDTVLAIPTDALRFASFPGGSGEPQNREVIENGPGDIVVEATFTNPVDGEPAVSHVRWALEARKHVCTTNKGPVALQGKSLAALARRRGVEFEFEGAVMSGTPVLRTATQLLSGAGVNRLEGILNGTSNYILGRLESGLDFDTAVAEAQARGYAEADPAADVGGLDVRLKVVILANEVLGADISPEEVSCSGITGLTPAEVQVAFAEGRRWRLIGRASRLPNGAIEADVRPVAVEAAHPLYSICGPTNAVTFHTDVLGPVTVSGPGAGRIETAYALLSDIAAIHRRPRTPAAQAQEAIGV